MSRIPAGVAAGVLVLVLTGCGPYAARSFPLGENEESVPGTWSHPDGATLVFAADGTFTYEDLPRPVSDGSSGDDVDCADRLEESTDRVSGGGTWSYPDDRVRVVFESDDTDLFPYGFLSFSGLEYVCDIDGPSYRFDRQG